MVGCVLSYSVVGGCIQWWVDVYAWLCVHSIPQHNTYRLPQHNMVCIQMHTIPLPHPPRTHSLPLPHPPHTHSPPLPHPPQLCAFQKESLDTGTELDARVVLCLQDYRDEIENPACQKRVRKYIELASEDIRFNVPLAEACYDDRVQLCNNVAPGSARVIRCLQSRCVGGEALRGLCGWEGCCVAACDECVVCVYDAVYNVQHVHDDLYNV